MPPYSLKDFPEIALREFPQLRKEFKFFKGLPYVQMGALAFFAQSAKGRADWETYERVVRLADQLWGNADAGLRNALNVSFLEHIDFNGPRGPHAWSLLSARMQRAWRAMAAYNDWVHSGAKGEPPPEADA